MNCQVNPENAFLHAEKITLLLEDLGLDSNTYVAVKNLILGCTLSNDTVEKCLQEFKLNNGHSGEYDSHTLEWKMKNQVIPQ